VEKEWLEKEFYPAACSRLGEGLPCACGKGNREREKISWKRGTKKRGLRLTLRGTRGEGRVWRSYLSRQKFEREVSAKGASPSHVPFTVAGKGVAGKKWLTGRVRRAARRESGGWEKESVGQVCWGGRVGSRCQRRALFCFCMKYWGEIE